MMPDRVANAVPDLVTLRQYGTGRPITEKPSQDDIELASRGLKESWDAVCSGEYSLAILDEASVATHAGLLDVDDLLSLVEEKPPRVELVVTGRWADPRLIERADLVTEMKKVKHYYDQGVSARVGIEK